MADPKSKKAFPLRISERLFDQIKRWADDDLRSVNGQIEYLLGEALKRRQRSKNQDDDPGKREPRRK